MNVHLRRACLVSILALSLAGCALLFDPDDWIPIPEDWHPNIVQGKGYDTREAAGARLWEQVQMRLQRYTIPLRVLPRAQEERPALEFIKWHNENVYVP